MMRRYHSWHENLRIYQLSNSAEVPYIHTAVSENYSSSCACV